MQTEPFRSAHSAALRLRDGAKLVDEKFPSYTNSVRASHDVGRSLLSARREYLTIQTGGKWGYGYELEEFLTVNAPVLDDAVFYVSDEYAMYVREWRITNGTLTVEFAAPDNSHVGLVLIETTKHRDFGLFLLDDMLDGMLWGGGEKEEPMSVRFRAVMALVQHRPERWHTWYQLGLLKSDYAERAAIEAFERALAIVPPEKRSLVEVGLVRTLEKSDPMRALAIGRQAVDRWIVEATKERSSFWTPLAPGIAHVADLERDHGAPEMALKLYTAWLRATDGDATGHRLYNLACLCAHDQPELARSYLRVALDFEPSLAQSARTDPDLAPIR
ncbi:MAG: hypothetical protein ACKV2T_36640 [Kofleriaceae bacterium]